MQSTLHQFGATSTNNRTDMVHYLCTNPVPELVSMKGKYPNGLAAAMKRRDISPAALAEASGTSRQQIDRLIHGEREMTAIWGERLAGPLRCTPEELVFPQLRRTRAPLLSWVSAGRLAHQEGVKKTDIRRYVLAADLPKGDWIVLEVSGDSMNRIAPDGSYIFVNCADQRLLNDEFYVFGTEEGEATFKRYREGQAGRPPRLQPYSTNPDHETLIVTDQTLVVGRVGRVVIDLH